MILMRGRGPALRTLQSVVAIAIVTALFASGCSGTTTPEQTAKDWTASVIAGDNSRTMQLTCARERDPYGIQAAFVPGAMLLQGAKSDAGSLTYQIDRNDGQTASVHVTGSAVTGTFGARSPVDLHVFLLREDGAWRVCRAP